MKKTILGLFAFVCAFSGVSCSEDDLSVDYSGSEVAVMVNGLGGTPLMELYMLGAPIRNRACCSLCICLTMTWLKL